MRFVFEATAENGRSRILVGFHVRHAVDAGVECGREIGDYAVDRFLGRALNSLVGPARPRWKGASLKAFADESRA